jgi:hypothetical protein|tara:strand:+ start:595 stop:867 length:273 start_codon:yes stop_codon:yes gene_type:complete
MKKRKFLNIEIEDAPLELELSVEQRCRDILASDDIYSIKRYCTHLVRHQMKQDVFLASLLGRLVELEAFFATHQQKKDKKGFMKRFFRTP